MSGNKILVTGFNGQLGKSIARIIDSFPQLQLVFFSHIDLDINNESLISSLLNTGNYGGVINCAAYTSVDLAETEFQKARLTNISGPILLAKKCNEINIPFIHFSSDYVYDNGLTRPLKETDPCSPKSAYAISKFEGEQAAIYYNPKSIIIRTSWVYSEYGNNFVKTILKLIKEKPELNVVKDQIGAPTYAKDLANVSLTILDKILTNRDFNQFGIYNYSNEGQISWFDFASEIAKISKSICNINPISTAGFPRPAPRPAYSVFDMTKIKTTFDIQSVPWKESLQFCIKNLSQINP